MCVCMYVCAQRYVCVCQYRSLHKIQLINCQHSHKVPLISLLMFSVLLKSDCSLKRGTVFPSVNISQKEHRVTVCIRMWWSFGTSLLWKLLLQWCNGGGFLCLAQLTEDAALASSTYMISAYVCLVHLTYISNLPFHLSQSSWAFLPHPLLLARSVFLMCLLVAVRYSVPFKTFKWYRFLLPIVAALCLHPVAATQNSKLPCRSPEQCMAQFPVEHAACYRHPVG